MKKLSILSVALIATIPAWSQNEKAMGNTKVNTDFTKYKTFTWAKSDPTAVGPNGYDIYYYEITPDRTRDMNHSDMNGNRDMDKTYDRDKTYNNDKSRSKDQAYNRDKTTDQTQYDKNRTDRNRTSSQTDRDRTSDDETQMSDLNRTSDQTRTSDQDKASDQYRKSDPNKTNDPNRTSDQDRTSDRYRTDRNRTTDPNKTSDETRTSDQYNQDRTSDQNKEYDRNDDMNRSRTDSYGNKPSGYVYSYTMIIPASNDQANEAIRDGITNELEGRGYREAGQDADLIVAYQVLDQKATLHGFNNDQPVTAGGEEVRQPSDTATFVLEPGTLMVSLIDAKTSQMVWHGWSSGMIENSAFTTDQADLKEAVHAIFDKFKHNADNARKD